MIDIESLIIIKKLIYKKNLIFIYFISFIYFQTKMNKNYLTKLILLFPDNEFKISRNNLLTRAFSKKNIHRQICFHNHELNNSNRPCKYCKNNITFDTFLSLKKK